MNQKADEPAIRVHGVDARGKMYAAIADCHKQIVEAKWKAHAMGDAKIQIQPVPLLMHLEESVHFLAQEMLALCSMLEERADVDPT